MCALIRDKKEGGMGGRRQQKKHREGQVKTEAERDWSDKSTSPRTQQVARSYQKLGERHRIDSLSEPP